MFSKISHPKMSVSAESTADTPASHNPKRTEEATKGTSHELIKERIKVNLRPPNEQIITLTRLLNQLIQESSALNSPMAKTRTQQDQSRRSPSREAANSRALPAREIGSTGSPHDSCVEFSVSGDLQNNKLETLNESLMLDYISV